MAHAKIDLAQCEGTMLLQEQQKIQVSVVMITFNHEKYIAQAIESVLMQETDFQFELVIGEDCSTDTTAEIVERYLELYPEKIRLLPRNENIGMIRNLVDAIHSSNGTFIALIEGDDFWTDSQKLQKQRQFLLENPQVSLCFHDVLHFQEDDGVCYRREKKPPRISHIEDLLVDHYVRTCSSMFRRDCLEPLPDWFYTLRGVDWVLFILLAKNGSLGYIDENMATYRVHQGGCWTSLQRTQQFLSVLEIYGHLNRHLLLKYNNLIRREMANTFLKLAREYAHHHEDLLAKGTLKKSILADPHILLRSPAQVLKTLIRLYGPALYRLARANN